jgi:hypothetical protein
MAVYHKETLCEYSSSNYGGNVTSWAYATRSNNEEAIKAVVATYGICKIHWLFQKKPIDNISMTKSFGVLHFDVDLLGPVAISIDANDWDFYR